MKVHQAIEEMRDAEILKVSATDMGFPADVESWCRRIECESVYLKPLKELSH